MACRAEKIVLLAGCLLSSLAAGGLADTGPEKPALETAAPETAAQASAPSDEPIWLSATSGGVRRYAPAEWSSLSVQATNKTDAEARGTLMVYLGEETQDQFARKVWIPPHSHRVTWLPVRPPQIRDPNQKYVSLTMMPVLESADGELITRREGRELTRSQLLILDRESIKTAALFRRSPSNDMGAVEKEIDYDAYELMVQARELAGASRVIMEFHENFAPPHPIMWESLDQFIICGDRILQDSAGLMAVRDWLYRGGRLCVFLDRTSPDTVAAILGHSASIRVVDRVELDEFSIEEITAESGTPIVDRRRLETPAQFVRVMAPDAEVHCRVNGWPAAFWVKAGEGEVLFLTLSPNGWRPTQIPPGFESLPEHSEPPFRSLKALQSVAERFYRVVVAKRANDQSTEAVLREQIGYRIPSRSLATSLLGLNALGLVLGGFWLARRNQLDRLALLLPILAGGISLVFFIIGFRNTQSVPPSIAFSQLVHFMPEVDQVRVSGVAGMYQQVTGDLQVTTGSNGLLFPPKASTEGTSHRLLWGDSDRGSWLQVSMPAGSVQYLKFQQSVQLAEHITATGRFQREGLVGKLHASAAEIQDNALIASLPAPSSAVRFQADGSFVAGIQDVLPAGQFLADAVVSDESRRRQEIFRQLIVPRDDSQFANEPTFLVWMKPQSGVLAIPPGLVELGTALGAIPLSLERTPPDTEFAVPATFLRMESVLGAFGKSLAYSARKGIWVSGSNRPTNTRLQFRLPRQVIPCQLTEARMTVKVNAPSRELQILAIRDGQEELIRRIENPSGVFEISVTRPEWLTLDAKGGLQFGINISQSQEEREKTPSSAAAVVNEPVPSAAQGIDSGTENLQKSFVTWEIDYLRLDVRGKTQ